MTNTTTTAPGAGAGAAAGTTDSGVQAAIEALGTAAADDQLSLYCQQLCVRRRDERSVNARKSWNAANAITSQFAKLDARESVSRDDR